MKAILDLAESKKVNKTKSDSDKQKFNQKKKWQSHLKPNVLREETHPHQNINLVMYTGGNELTLCNLDGSIIDIK